MTQHPSRTPAVVGAVVVSAIALATALAAPVVMSSRLGDRLASHWDLAGRADGSMAPLALALLCGAIVVAGGAALVAGVARAGSSAAWPPLATFLGVYLVTMFTALSVQIVVTNLDHPDWRAVPGPSVWVILAATILPALLAGGACRWLAGRWPSVPPTTDAIPPRPIEVAEGERAVWIGRCANRLLAGVSAALIAVGGVLAVVTVWWIGLLLGVAGLVTLPLSAVTVVVDPNGLQVRYGALGWPVTRIPVEQVTASSAIDVEPSRWGGWGYRGSLHLMRRAAVVLRRGEGIRADLSDHRVFVVTVDDASTGAALLDTYRSRTPAA